MTLEQRIEAWIRFAAAALAAGKDVDTAALLAQEELDRLEQWLERQAQP